MSLITGFFTPHQKRHRHSRNSSSSSSNDTPARKKQFSENPFSPLSLIEGIDMASISNPIVEPQDLENGINVEQEPNWAKKHFTKMCDISTKMCEMSEKLNELCVAHNNLEHKVETALSLSQKSACDITKLEKQVQELTLDNDKLRHQVSDAESYSKKYNLKFFNIPEVQHETPNILMDKLAVVLQVLDLDLSRIHIDNIHRLPSTGRGPKPVIVKFVSFLDRNAVWSRKQKLAASDLGVFIREHYCQQVEENIRKLLPIRRAALQQNLSVRLVQDILSINNQRYTVNNLHQLPESLKPENVSVREEDGHLFFFSESNPLSNYHPAHFTINRETFTCSEQYIQKGKALLFNDTTTANQIMAATTPQEMKRLGSKVSNFSPVTWKEKAPGIALTGLEQKFRQNPSLKDYLVKTDAKILVEASPHDKLWGIGVYMYDRDLIKKKDTWGNNLLGKSLMEIRDLVTHT